MITIRFILLSLLFPLSLLHANISIADTASQTAPFNLSIESFTRQLTLDEKNHINQALALPENLSPAGKSSVEAASFSGVISQKPPTWNYLTTFNNEPQIYSNIVIGGDPQAGGRTNVNIVVIPIALKLHKQMAALDFVSFPTQYVNVKKHTTVSLAVPDQCNTVKKKSPLALVKESPLFRPANIRFGNKVLKNSQYIDAHQRASFWRETGGDKNGYHLWLNPTFNSELAVDVPYENGVAVDSSLILGNPACGTIAQVDFVWLDNYLRETAIPNLTAKGIISPSKVPVFLIKNLGLAQNTDTFSIFAQGYHDVVVSNTTGVVNLQTYMVADIGMGALSIAPSDIRVLSHELGEWVNNPFLTNFAPGLTLYGYPVPTPKSPTI